MPSCVGPNLNYLALSFLFPCLFDFVSGQACQLKPALQEGIFMFFSILLDRLVCSPDLLPTLRFGHKAAFALLLAGIEAVLVS